MMKSFTNVRAKFIEAVTNLLGMESGDTLTTEAGEEIALDE